MLYPFKFEPIYKDYIWGGRNLERLGKALPDGSIAESWEISCYPEACSIISNGGYKGFLLKDVVKMLGSEIIGTVLDKKYIEKFPLLVKFIDANDRLSVQVHPDDVYASKYENGESGKNEAWYILNAKPGARLIYDVVHGTTKPSFMRLLEENSIESCLNSIEVAGGDVISIPAGVAHAVGEGIMLIEIQQSSNLTYRIYDYDRTDKNGARRPLHIEQAMEVMDFNSGGRRGKFEGLKVSCGTNCTKSYKIANQYFSVESYDLDGEVWENADGSRFHIYICYEGKGEISYTGGTLGISAGESVLMPAAIGKYSLRGKFKSIKTYVPDLKWDVVIPLMKAGYDEAAIYENVGGLDGYAHLIQHLTKAM